MVDDAPDSQAHEKSDKLSTWTLIREDLSRHDWHSPGFRALAIHRFGEWVFSLKPGVFQFILRQLYWIMFHYVRNHYGIEIRQGAKIGRRLRIAHHFGVVIGGSVSIGDYCLMRQNVNIGAASRRHSKGRALIGNHVEFGAGAQILGRITIGDGARIGANAVVTTDVPPHSIVFVDKPKIIALPAALLNKKNDTAG